MIDYIKLFNEVGRAARPAHHEFVPVTSMEDKFVESCFDSLDMLMIVMYMSEIYDIDDEIAKEMYAETMQEMYDLIQQHKKRDPESMEWAMEVIK
jgi:acyl carrier protein